MKQWIIATIPQHLRRSVWFWLGFATALVYVGFLLAQLYELAYVVDVWRLTYFFPEFVRYAILVTLLLSELMIIALLLHADVQKRIASVAEVAVYYYIGAILSLYAFGVLFRQGYDSGFLGGVIEVPFDGVHFFVILLFMAWTAFVVGRTHALKKH